jgi:hypothetical protein
MRFQLGRSKTEQLQHLSADLQGKLSELHSNVSGEVQLFSEQLRSLSAEIAQLNAELAPQRMRRFLDAMHRTAHLKIKAELPAAQAIAAGLQAVVAPPPPGVAGGRARAWHAWHHDDGRFMSYDEEEQIRAEQRERMAHDGQARAHGARRAPDGTFL